MWTPTLAPSRSSSINPPTTTSSRNWEKEKIHHFGLDKEGHAGDGLLLVLIGVGMHGEGSSSFVRQGRMAIGAQSAAVPRSVARAVEV